MTDYRLDFSRINCKFQAYLSLSTPDEMGEEQYLLTEREKLQLSNYEGARAKEFVASRLLIKRQVNTFYRDKNAGNAEVVHGVFGQPLLNINNNNMGLGVSIAHKTDLVSAVLFDLTHPLGLDIEPILHSKLPSFEKQLTRQEIRADLTHELKGIYMWTAKEALSKVLGCGMTVPYGFYEVKNYEGNECGAIGEFSNFYQYRFVGFEVLGHIISIVYPSHSKIEISKINNG